MYDSESYMTLQLLEHSPLFWKEYQQQYSRLGLWCSRAEYECSTHFLASRAERTSFTKLAVRCYV